MKTKTPKAKRCGAESCRSLFVPTRPLAAACSPLCALEIARQVREKKARQEALEDRRVTKVKLDDMKPIAKFIASAQRSFNAYIRERDKDQPCICCGRTSTSIDGLGAHGWDSGHYRSTGSASHLRFNEDNVHRQLVYCNRHGAGRAVDYRIGLIARIGLSRVEALEANNEPRKWTREELIEIKTKYAALARQLRKERE